MTRFPPVAVCALLIAIDSGLGAETECSYGLRVVRGPASSAAALYSIPDDFARPPRPYLRHNSAGGLALHHVVPHWMLKRFFNRVCRRNVNAEVKVLGALLRRVLRSALRANHMLIDVDPEDVEEALLFTKHMIAYDAHLAQGAVLNDPRFGRGWCLAVMLFSWLPGDLFFGPAPFLRRDDPRNKFDTKAINIMETGQYNLLVDLYEKMEAFVRGPSWELVPTQKPTKDFVEIIYQLDAIISQRVLYLYDPADWSVAVKNKFIDY